MYTLRIKDLTATTTLGVYDWEKQAPRQVILNAELHVKDTGAGTSDNVADTIDYALIETRILDHLAQNSFQLVERLVTETARLILSLDNRITRVTLEADKPGALRHARSVSVATTLSQG